MELLGFVLLGFVAGILIWNRMKKRQAAAFDKALRESPVPVFLPVDEATLCTTKGTPHSWEELDMMDAFSGKTATSKVCMECGFISSLNKQFSPDGLQNIREQRKILKELNELTLKEVDSSWDVLLKNLEFSTDRIFSTEEKRSMKIAFEAGIACGPGINAAVKMKYAQQKKAEMLKKAADIPGIQK